MSIFSLSPPLCQIGSSLSSILYFPDLDLQSKDLDLGFWLWLWFEAWVGGACGYGFSMHSFGFFGGGCGFGYGLLVDLDFLFIHIFWWML